MLDVIEMDWQADMGVHQVEEKNLKMDISEIQLQRSEVANYIYQFNWASTVQQDIAMWTNTFVQFRHFGIPSQPWVTDECGCLYQLGLTREELLLRWP